MSDLRPNTWSIVSIVVCAGLMMVNTIARADVTQAGNADIDRLVAAGVPLIDVRTPGEWRQTGVIEGSRLATFFDEHGRFNLERWLSDLDGVVVKDRPFMLICQVGGRTRVLSEFLSSKLNYSKVINVTKGIQHWINEGRKTVPPTIEN